MAVIDVIAPAALVILAVSAWILALEGAAGVSQTVPAAFNTCGDVQVGVGVTHAVAAALSVAGEVQVGVAVVKAH